MVSTATCITTFLLCLLASVISGFAQKRRLSKKFLVNPKLTRRYFRQNTDYSGVTSGQLTFTEEDITDDEPHRIPERSERRSQPLCKQHFLYFLPLPQGQGSFLPIPPFFRLRRERFPGTRRPGSSVIKQGQVYWRGVDRLSRKPI